MPTDLTKLTKLAGSPTAGQLGSEQNPAGAWVQDPAAMAKIIAEVIKVNFPQVLSTSAQISKAAPPDRNSLGDFNPTTKNIRLAPSTYSGSATTFYDKSGKQTDQQVGFTTEDVMSSVNLLLHELVHARSARNLTSSKLDSQYKISPEKQDKINTLQRLPDPSYQFLSVDPNKLNIEEFLANADSISKLGAIGGIVENSALSRQQKTLQNIIKQVPEVKKLIDSYSNPETAATLPSSKDLGAAVLDLIKSKLP